MGTFLETLLSEQPSFQLTSEKEQKLESLSTILSLSENETNENYKMVTNPIFQKKNQRICGSWKLRTSTKGRNRNSRKLFKNAKKYDLNNKNFCLSRMLGRINGKPKNSFSR